MSEKYLEYYRGRKVLVTGGLGFIGCNACLRLLELGAEVTVLDNFIPPDPSGRLAEISSRLRIAVADLRDEEKVERVVRGQEVILNLAGKSGAVDSNKTPLNDLDINCRGQLVLLEACRSFASDVSIVFPSSRLVYGKPQYLPVDERHPLAPASIYATHKLAAENYHLIYGSLYGMKTTVLRISNPYGPMQAGESRPYGIANRFIQAAAAGKEITLFGDGGQKRDYLYISDLVDALLRAGFSEAARGKIYNIGDSSSVTMLELAEMAVTAAGAGKIVRVPWPDDYREVETGDYQSDISMARSELGWKPVTEIVEGIARTAASYK